MASDGVRSSSALLACIAPVEGFAASEKLAVGKGATLMDIEPLPLQRKRLVKRPLSPGASANEDSTVESCNSTEADADGDKQNSSSGSESETNGRVVVELKQEKPREVVDMVPSTVIPFHMVCYVGKEQQYIMEAMASGRIAGEGPFSERCSLLLEQALGVPKVLLTTSCTDALEMCALLLQIKEGDEVILPSFTYVSTVNAFVLYGARPVFVDVRKDTLNINENLIEQAITERTKAIVIVHYGGYPCAMDDICAIAQKYRVPLIEDNAHALFARYKGRPAGTFGCLSTVSFHGTKNFTCGEGGALFVNDPAMVDRAMVLLNKGTDRTRFMLGLTPKYTWVDKGSSFLPSDILAAMLLAQLESRSLIQGNRKRLWLHYHRSLQQWAREQNVQLPVGEEEWGSRDEHAYHIFYMVLPSKEVRVALTAHLQKLGVKTATHYEPLHLSPMGMAYGGSHGQCPVTENTSCCLLRLPLFTNLVQVQQEHIIQSVLSFRHDAS
eukprot:TRINITY_DN1521_c0_g1_i1.p1 TRINITY_DN1521_c0_g1~~TRINITY_DN1521_c0_g1_i1.p1  ORF type:complete len:504 (-),score=114.45 TRINITY_DN1521_c0_g1_i1:418-1908(-)